jgi:hypothetical protein
LIRDSGSLADDSSPVGRARARVYVNRHDLRRANGGERSRNVIDRQGRSDLSRSQGTKPRVDCGHIPPSHPGTVTTGKVPVTAAGRSKIKWQAGMSKLMSDVRGYVGSYRQRVYVNAADSGREGREGWETPAAPRNVPKNEELGGICRGRRERQSGFLRNSASSGVSSVALQLRSRGRSRLPVHFGVQSGNGQRQVARAQPFAALRTGSGQSAITNN